MIDILAHRGMLDSMENSIRGISNCVKLGIGIEIDLRLGKNGVYLSHDVKESGELFEEACKILANSKITVAIHVKEVAVVKETLELLKKYSLKNCFLFNTEVMICETNNDCFAFYANKNPTNIKEKILWCDEVKEKWYDYETISSLHKQRKILYAMSKEVVIGSCHKIEMQQEWKRLMELGVDGICTKYPKELLVFLKRDE
jgi:glycerophosphoryl diester phosphodiesterase